MPVVFEIEDVVVESGATFDYKGRKMTVIERPPGDLNEAPGFYCSVESEQSDSIIDYSPVVKFTIEDADARMMERLRELFPPKESR